MPPRKRSTSTKRGGSTAKTVAESAAAAAAKKSADNGDDNKKNQSLATLNPVTTSYEWGGPIGALFCIIFLPVTVIAINSLCGWRTPNCEISYLWDQPNLDHLGLWDKLKETIGISWHDNFIGVEEDIHMLPRAIGMLLCWYTFHCIFYLVWPLGGRGPGMQLRNGKRLMYNFNALWSMIVSYVLIFGGHYLGYFNVSVLIGMFTPLMLGSIILALIFSVLLYVASYRPSSGNDKLTAAGGNSGNIFYDFWVGRELNPRLGELDFKWVFELRPGLIGWTILSWSFVISQYQTILRETGAPQNFSQWFTSDAHRQLLPTLGACLCNFFYIIDALKFEPGNITMMDIVYDGFGFMLCFGDIAWVPFLYTLQCKYLYIYPQTFSNLWLLFAAAVYVVGYITFRFSNSQKDQFRKNPTDPRVAHLKTMKTKRGTSLIVSSWWGICRHPNYVGDWLMVVGTSLFCGVDVLLPWFQPVYFAILLIHRQFRDEEWMLHKYGKEDWEAYCKHVPYRLIPGVY